MNSKKVALKNGLNFNREIIYGNQKMELFQITKKDWQAELTQK